MLSIAGLKFSKSCDVMVLNVSELRSVCYKRGLQSQAEV
jgi:hypothetical protein